MEENRKQETRSVVSFFHLGPTSSNFQNLPNQHCHQPTSGGPSVQHMISWKEFHKQITALTAYLA